MAPTGQMFAAKSLEEKSVSPKRPVGLLTVSLVLAPRSDNPKIFLQSISRLALTHSEQNIQRLWSINISGWDASTSRIGKFGEKWGETIPSS